VGRRNSVEYDPASAKGTTVKLTAEQQKVLLAKYGVCANDACDKCDTVLCEFRESRLNLAICPSELIALDPNAEMLWPKLLRTVRVIVSKGEHIEERRAKILRTFGLPSLLICARRSRSRDSEYEDFQV
jgi:hypothetical protein